MKPYFRNILLAFIIATLLFGTGFWLSNQINDLRLAELRNIQDRIGTDILSLETQFDLLESLSCQNIRENSVLSSELNTLASRLAYTENALGSQNEEVKALKRQYSLLEIKDYLLMQKVSGKCGLKPVFVLYFYSNEGDCNKCETAGHVLTYLRETYPQLRVYSFDYHLDIGALKTLITVNKIEPRLPAFVINGTVHYDLDDAESIEKILPLDKLATSSAPSIEKELL
ncbi:hypothetical protein A2841_03790 [Candidatus Kaiserbacteria bacterium RIFCSPHIGHO2_01_FULL_48_10]|uniref:Thioredoxin domain-containing protein n=1 Tax=Candidatus Kaiserbacteria bacterium RIFCSPHIGHO2_01_FULL_48_10 TaxID=1798476 RepID=A0A1F6C4R2_9BACT|nr:MAG: hypothetical protein A2841_03790 [Candidatus Kaiserbacteria bacterium RIFCSPHIGHO2_01_FULL_48_10]